MQAESQHGVTTQTWNLVEKLNSTNRELCNIPYKEAYIDLSTKTVIRLLIKPQILVWQACKIIVHQWTID